MSYDRDGGSHLKMITKIMMMMMMMMMMTIMRVQNAFTLYGTLFTVAPLA